MARDDEKQRVFTDGTAPSMGARNVPSAVDGARNPGGRAGDAQIRARITQEVADQRDVPRRQAGATTQRLMLQEQNRGIPAPERPQPFSLGRYLFNQDSRREQVARGSASSDPSKPLTFVSEAERDRRLQYQMPPTPFSSATPAFGATELPTRGSADRIIRQAGDRIPSPNEPGGSAPTSATAAAMRPNMGPNMGPSIPGDGRPTNVPGIFQRTGSAGEPEFYNLTNNMAPDRLTGTGLGRSDQTRGAVQGMQDRQDARMQALLRNEQGMQARPAGGGAVAGAGGRGGSDLQLGGQGPQFGGYGPRFGSSAGGGGSDMFAEARDLQKQAQRLFQQAQRTNDPRQKSPMIREAQMLAGMAEKAMGSATAMYGADSTAATEDNKLAAAAAVASAEKPLTDKDRSEIVKNLATAGYDNARIQQLMQQIQQQQFNPFAIDNDTFNAFQAAFGREGAQQYIEQSQQMYRSNEATNLLRQQGRDPVEIISAYREGQLTDNDPAVRLLKQAGMLTDETERKAMGGLVGSMMDDEPMSFAEGGYVDDPMMADPAMMDMGMGGMDMGALDMAGMGGDMGMAGMQGMQDDPMMQDYEQYAAVAEEMGLPVIPYEQFAQIMAAAQQPDMPPEGAMGFARGGAVDTSGKMVVDPNPNAPTDSIPAMIDGEKPAALDSGEFVIPRHAVMFHGIDKLNKLIAQAEGQGQRGTNQ